MEKLRRDDGSKIILLALLCQMILALPLEMLKGDARVYLGYLVPQIVYIGVVVFYLRYKKAPILSILPIKKKINPLAIILAFVVTIGVFMQNLILAVGFNWIMESFGVTMEVNLPPLNNALNLILIIITIAVLPAIGEELIFRGVFLSAMEEKGQVYAVFLSALVFSLSHLNPAQLIHQFILGVILAYITIRTKNIIYAIVIHFFNNLFAIVLPLIIPPFNNLGIMSLQNAIIMCIISVVGIVILYPALKMLIKTCSSQENNRDKLGFFRFFIKKDHSLWYNMENKSPKKDVSFWLVILVSILTVGLILNTILLTYPITI